MDELNLFRDFNRGLAGPDEDTARRASASLLRAIEGEQALSGGTRRRIQRRHGAIALAFAMLSGAAIAALFVSTPWTGPPGFLERAHAALTPPPGTILHVKSEATSPDAPACTLAEGTSEVWIDQSTRRYRLLVSPPDPFAARDAGCPRGTEYELGGTLGTKETLRFEPPNTITSWPGEFVIPLDPVADLRAAISDGWARQEGRTEIDGHTVERIRMDIPLNCSDPPCDPSYAYVDPETLYPVQIAGQHLSVLSGGSVKRHHIVERYLIYEYLPRTAANVALTDILGQHPDATGR